MDAGSYRLANVILTARGGGVYASAQGAVIIPQAVDGRRSSGSTRLNGRRMLGVCSLAPDSRSETCTFDLGGQTLIAVDRLRDRGWDRRYQDGQVVRIELDRGRPVPVPIAVGR